MAHGVVGEWFVLADCLKGATERELQCFADRRSGSLANVVTIHRVAQGGRCHACESGELFGREAAVLDASFEVDLAMIQDVAAHAFLHLLAVEQSDLLGRDAVDAQVAELLLNDRRHFAVALDRFLFQVHLGVRLEEGLDELAELDAAGVSSLTGFTLLLKQDRLPLDFFVDLILGHAGIGCVCHRLADLFAVDIVAAGHHDEVTVVALSDGRHMCLLCKS